MSIKREKLVRVHLTENEFDQLVKNAEKTRYSREEYIRKVMNRIVPYEAPPVDYYSLIIEVRKAGEKAVEILKLAKDSGLLDVEDYHKYLEEIKNVKEMLYEAFSEKRFLW